MGQTTSDISVASYDIEDIIGYIHCPALFVIRTLEGENDQRYIERSNTLKGIRDLVIRSLNRTQFMLEDIEQVLKNTLSSFTNTEMSGAGVEVLKKKAMKISTTIVNLSNMIAERFMITGGPLPLSVAIRWINRDRKLFDIVVRDTTRGYLHPGIIDLSGSQLGTHYSSASYRCQVICDHYGADGRTIIPVVFVPALGKVWFYERTQFSQMLKVAIHDAVRGIHMEVFPPRLGWWCASCSFHNTCYRFMNKRQ
jgi:hypothetical protein